MDNKKNLVVAVAAVIICLAAGFYLGYFQGQKVGYNKAIAETQAIKDEIVKKAVEEAMKAANPFQTINPLEGITANPFQDAAKKLNPFTE